MKTCYFDSHAFHLFANWGKRWWVFSILWLYWMQGCENTDNRWGFKLRRGFCRSEWFHFQCNTRNDHEIAHVKENVWFRKVAHCSNNSIEWIFARAQKQSYHVRVHNEKLWTEHVSKEQKQINEICIIQSYFVISCILYLYKYAFNMMHILTKKNSIHWLMIYLT